mgnify:CR=1 FL=1
MVVSPGSLLLAAVFLPFLVLRASTRRAGKLNLISKNIFLFLRVWQEEPDPNTLLL